MNSTNWPGTYQGDNPVTQDPRWQRRIISFFRPIPVVENCFDTTLQCGHAPLMFRDQPPQEGEVAFCPDCYEQSKEKA